jgi:hypothetical protein
MEDVLRRVYYDRRNGFGSVQDTYRRARQIDPSITLKATQAFLKKQEVRQLRKQHKYNSFVASGPREEFQVDLADFGRYAEPRYGLAAVDVFTKKLHVEPIANKEPKTTALALDKVVQNMSLPNNVMHDEGGEFQGAFAKRLEYFDIKDHPVRTHPRFIDRAIRTFKDAARKRMQALGEDDWTDVREDVLDKYNETKHTATGVAPNDVEGKNETAAYLSMSMRAKKQRVDPPLAVGDDVRRALKTDKINKSGPNWSKELYKVEGVEQTELGKKYKITEHNGAFFRHELLKVDAVEQAPGVLPLSQRPTLKQVKLRERLQAQRDQIFSIVLRRREMSLTQLALQVKDIMPELRRQGIKTLSEFLRLYPGWFALVRNNTVVKAVDREAAAAEKAAAEDTQMGIASRGGPQRQKLALQGQKLVLQDGPLSSIASTPEATAAAERAAEEYLKKQAAVVPLPPRTQKRDASYFRGLRQAFGRGP